MSTKPYPMIRKFLALKFKRLSFIQFTKVDVHQDDINKFDQSSFVEKLNTECDLRAKTLITNTPEDEIVPFALELNYVHVTNSDNQLVLNCAGELVTHFHLISSED